MTLRDAGWTLETSREIYCIGRGTLIDWLRGRGLTTIANLRCVDFVLDRLM
jgi:hypothetical protein